LVGNFKNAGREWHLQGAPELVDVHDFPDDAVGKAIPYGVYDVGANNAFVSVGMDHDTPLFAVAAIKTWWLRMGATRHPRARELSSPPMPAAATGSARACENPRASSGYPRQPLPAGDKQVEQDRATAPGS
jgi:hypothetical protein